MNYDKLEDIRCRIPRIRIIIIIIIILRRRRRMYCVSSGVVIYMFVKF
jgi:hypothetical protein